jgi:hypothetical protein
MAVPKQIFGRLRPCRGTRSVEGRPIWEGRRLVTKGTDKRRLGRRWLAENERKTESHSRAQLIDGPSINQRAVECYVERKLVIHLPYGANETGERLRYVEDAVRIDLKDRSDFPFVRTLYNGVKEKLSMLILSEVRLYVEVNGSPFPPLRDDAAPAKPIPEPPTSGNRGPNSMAMLGPFLSWRTPGCSTYFRKAASGTLSGPPSSSGGCAVPCRTSSQHAVGDWLSCRSGVRGPNGLKLDFNLADIGDCGVCSIERTVWEGGDRPTDRA